MKKLLLCASAFALMLGSCSKDDTEVAPVSGNNEVIFTAGMTIGNDTRTGVGVDPNDGKKIVYTWDFGDMVGASVSAGKVVPFVNISASGSANAQFTYSKNDVEYVGEKNEVYFVYPYGEGNTVTDGTVTLTVPASQRYRDDSFAPMTAPAVAYTESFEMGADYTFNAVTSFIRVPLIGNGKLTSLKMQIDNGSAPLKIAGSNTVNIKDETPKLTATEGFADAILIDFGNGGFELSYSEPKYVVFVVPADLTIQAGTNFSFTATVDGKESTASFTAPVAYQPTTLPVNTMLTIASKDGIALGVDDKIVVKTQSDFIKYVHQVSLGLEGASDDYKVDGEFKTAILVNNLAFNTFNAGDAYAENQAKGEDADELLAAALNWYIANGNSFTSIAAGAKIEGDGVKTLSYMKVKGGLFADRDVTLENVTFRSTTVDVAGMETPSFLNALPKCEAVTITAPVIANLPEGANGVYLNSVNANALPENKEMKLGFSPTVPYFANILTVNASVDVNGDANYRTLFGSTLRFVSIKGRTAGKIISNVSTAAVEGLLKAIDVTGKSFSVLSGRGNRAVSYWTGIPATGITADEYLTAEELAWAMQQTSRPVITLTNNIDLSKDYGKVWKPAGQVITINGEGYTVSNAKVYNESTLNGDFATYSLFGNVATVSNLNVKSVEIAVDKLPEGATSAIVGGLAAQGSANDVTIDDLSISVGKDIAFLKGYNTVGGLISKPNGVSVGNSVSNLSININGNENVEYVGGMFGVAYDGVYTKGEVELASFSENEVASWAEGATAYPLVGVWTVTNNANVDLCKNAGAALVGDLVAKASANGQSLYIVFEKEGCSTPYYANLVNGGTTSTTVYINGEHNELK